MNLFSPVTTLAQEAHLHKVASFVKASSDWKYATMPQVWHQ